jgi:curved DNA-binding protein CbpA
LLSLEHSADADAIKKAFRREIARYHPDKVIHLGPEFQEIAATRAAELTAAYKTLTDPALRTAYDASLGAAATAPPAAEYPPPTVDQAKTPVPPGQSQRFASERADRDVILRRAIAARVLSSVEALYGKCETPSVPGFDVATVPLAKPRFLGTAPPRVLVRAVDVADAAAVNGAFNAAARARLHAGKSPVVVLLFARRIAAHTDLAKAWDALARQRRPPDTPEDLSILVVDVADWSCRLPPNCSSAARKLAAQICVSS